MDVKNCYCHIVTLFTTFSGQNLVVRTEFLIRRSKDYNGFDRHAYQVSSSWKLDQKSLDYGEIWCVVVVCIFFTEIGASHYLILRKSPTVAVNNIA